jgi:hypothetical protein
MLKFMSGVSDPPEGEEEQRRITSTLHALDHATRFAETASGEAAFTTTKGGPEDVGAAELCAEAIQCVASVAGEVPADPADIGRKSDRSAAQQDGSTEADATLAAPPVPSG